MASSKQRKAGGSQFTNGKNRNRSPRLSSPRPGAAAQDLNEPRGEAARVLGHNEIALRAFEIYLSRGEWPGSTLKTG